jgi:hypothetical protein
MMGSRAQAALGLIGAALLTGCSAALDPVAVADAQTAARVKTALVNDPVVGAVTIEVRVVRGVASLSGRVRSAAEAHRVVTIARSVDGVVDVQPNLQLGADLAPTPSEPSTQLEAPGPEASEIDPPPSLLAVGLAGGWSVPRLEALKTRVAISPLIKIGSPSGLGPAVGFDWFHADLESIGGAATLTRVHVKPVMAGVGYTLTGDRFSLTPSIVAGYAFNSLTVKDTGAIQGLPVEVRNSFAWRVGGSVWYDVGRRVAVNGSLGYLMTGFRLTVLTDGRLDRRRASGDTAIVHAGVAYRLF